jgi:ABC-type glycerol-3-phosphate transport system substrate-binding protein
MWEDVLRMARQRSGPARRQYGWVAGEAKGNPILNSFFVLLHDFGGDIFGENWKVFNSPQAVEALEFYLSLLNYAPPGTAELDSDREGATLLQGNATVPGAIWSVNTWMPPALRDCAWLRALGQAW